MLSANPTDKSVGYFHSSASPTFAAKPLTGICNGCFEAVPPFAEDLSQPFRKGRPFPYVLRHSRVLDQRARLLQQSSAPPTIVFMT